MFAILKSFCSVGRAFNSGIRLSIFLSSCENDANSEQPQLMHHIMFGNILLLQTMLMLRKAVIRMLSVCFVITASVDAALPEQQGGGAGPGRLLLLLPRRLPLAAPDLHLRCIARAQTHPQQEGCRIKFNAPTVRLLT